MRDRMTYLVAYDIRCNRRRSRVLDFLRNYGMPVQKSVVECELLPRELTEVRARMGDLIQRRVDQVRIYPLCRACLERSEVIGEGTVAGRDVGY